VSCVTPHPVTPVTLVPVTTITLHPVTPVTDWGMPGEGDFDQRKRTAPRGDGTRKREVEQVADKEITPREPAKAKEDKSSDDKAATRVSRVRKLRRSRRMKK